MIRLEAIGVPGAGKTTLVQAVAETLREEGFSVWTRPEHQRAVAIIHQRRGRVGRAIAFASFLSAHPGLVRAVARLNIATRPHLAIGWRRTYFLVRQSRNDSLVDGLANRPDLVLHDQNLLQEVWSILYLRSCSDDDALRAVVAELATWLPDVIVVPLVSGSLALERMSRRRRVSGSTTDLDRMPHLRPEDLERTQREAERIAEMAASVRGATLVRTDGAASPGSQAKHVLDALRPLVPLSLRGLGEEIET